jgi:transposase-like protein
MYLDKAPSSKSIGGPGVIVEIDESKFGKRKYNKGHHVEGAWVFGARERENGKNCFFVVVEDRKKETLIPLIQSRIQSGSIIYSDCWSSYACLNSLGYEHYTVNHSENFKDPVTGVHTNSIEGTWQKIKHGVTFPRFGVRKEHLASYLAEYHWRCRFGDEELWHAYLECIREVFSGHCEEEGCVHCRGK